MSTDLGDALRAAATAELAWTEDAAPRARAVVPLVAGRTPVVAFPYAYADWARSLSTRPTLTLTVSDRRLGGRAWRPVALAAVPRLVEDVEGEVFVETLLDQELRKHPPSRALADSVLLRREQWWYLPRLLLHLDVVSVGDFVERSGEQEVLLVTARPGAEHAPLVRPVRVDGYAQRPLRVRPRDDEPLPDADEALLFGHDFTPDLERWISFGAAGPLRDGVLDAPPPAERAARRMPGLLERIRRHRELERACRAGLRQAR